MSTEFLYVIPTEPVYVPPPDARERALAAFGKMMPQSGSVDAIVHAETRFIDPGLRFDLVECPLCGSELDPIWWGDAMNSAERSDFKNLKVRLPCCDAPGDLNRLSYRMPAGFARFLLQAREPGPGRYLTVDKLQVLESILGTPLQQIWAQRKEQDKGQLRVYRAVAAGAASGRR